MREVVEEGEKIGEWFAEVKWRDSEEQRKERRGKINVVKNKRTAISGTR